MEESVRKLENYALETDRLARDLGLQKRLESALLLKKSTRRDYRRVARKRLDFDDANGGRLLEGVSRQSWYHHRAALLTWIAFAFSEQVIQYIEALKEAEILKAAKHAKQLRRKLDVFQRVQASRRPEKRSAPKKSKRKSLPRSADWQQRAIEKATPVMRAAIVCGMVGARPDEIERGIVVEFLPEEKAIRVTIRGAKVTEKSGQPWRRLFFSLDSQLGLHLKDLIPAQASEVIVSRRARRIALDWSQHIAPALRADVSHYSLRHQFAANLKAAGYPKEEIAKALGHLSVRSQQQYGSNQQGQAGRVGLQSVEAARDIISAEQGYSKYLDKSVDLFEP